MRPITYYVLRSCTFLALLGLAGCARYRVTLNEQPIYTPPPLYSKFEVSDPALADCLHQTIADQNITVPEQLKRLTCRHAGLETLAGLEHFAALEELDISHNKLREVAQLARLPQLRKLQLNDNPSLQCTDLAPLARPNLQITPPAHCVQ